MQDNTEKAHTISPGKNLHPTVATLNTNIRGKNKDKNAE